MTYVMFTEYNKHAPTYGEEVTFPILKELSRIRLFLTSENVWHFVMFAPKCFFKLKCLHLIDFTQNDICTQVLSHTAGRTPTCTKDQMLTSDDYTLQIYT